MMSQEQAAQYFVVAWVKDWSLRTYFRVVTQVKDTPWDQAHGVYPWLPDEGWFIRNSTVKRYLAEAHRVLNDALWDAADNKARLALAPRIAAFRFAPFAVRLNVVRQATKASANKALVARQTLGLALEEIDRASGHHWGVCK